MDRSRDHERIEAFQGIRDPDFIKSPRDQGRSVGAKRGLIGEKAYGMDRLEKEDGRESPVSLGCSKEVR
jgi:hypothetical protein